MRKALYRPLVGLCAFVLMTQVALAGTEVLLKVTNDIDREVYDLAVITDDDDHAVGLKLIDRNKRDRYYDVSNLKRGVVLKKVGSHEVIVLSSSDFEKDRGGQFKLSYLSNGVTGSRKKFDLKCQLDGDGWNVYYKGEKVNLMNFLGKKVLGKLIGIKDVVIK